MRGRIFWVISIGLSICFSSAILGSEPLTINLKTTSLTINDNKIHPEELSTTIYKYLCNINSSKANNSSAYIIIKTDEDSNINILNTTIKEIALSIHDFKNRFSVRHYQNYYESLSNSNQSKVDSACYIQVKRITNLEEFVIIPQINH